MRLFVCLFALRKNPLEGLQIIECIMPCRIITNSVVKFTSIGDVFISHGPERYQVVLLYSVNGQ